VTCNEEPAATVSLAGSLLNKRYIAEREVTATCDGCTATTIVATNVQGG